MIKFVLSVYLIIEGGSAKMIYDIEPPYTTLEQCMEAGHKIFENLKAENPGFKMVGYECKGEYE